VSTTTCVTDSASENGRTTFGSGVATVTTTLANLPPQRLEITANPEFVKLAITLQDGTAILGKTPFSQHVPGGNIHIDFTKSGYNSTSRDLTLDRSTAFKIWLDPEGRLYQSLVRFKCGPNPKQVIFTPDGTELGTSLLGGYGLEIYEPTTGKKLGGVKLGEHGAVEVVFTRDGATAYASQMETASVYEIDRTTREVKRQFDTGGSWTKVLLLSPDEKTLWASNWVSGDVSEIDLVTDTVTKLADTDRRPNSMDIGPDGRVLYMSNRGKDNPKTYYIPGPEWGTILAIDTTTGTILDAIVGGNQCTGLDVSPDGTLLAFSDFLDNKIRVYSIPPYDTLVAGGGGRAEDRFEDMIKD